MWTVLRQIDSLNEIDKFLESYKLLMHTQKEINLYLLNKPVSVREIEFIVKNLHTKVPGPDGFTGEF